jgi:anti-sigma-K factor RskA
MIPSHDEQTLAAGFVLGALDPEERRRFEAHARGCQACSDEVRSLRRVADALARTVPQFSPPPELRARVLSSATGLTLHDVRAPLSRPSRSGWLAMAAALILAVGAGGYALRLQSRVATLETRLDEAESRAAAAESATRVARRTADEAQTALGVLAAPDLVRIDLAGGKPAPSSSARAMWSRQRGMVFTATNLPPLPPGRVYQVWVVAGQTPISAGLVSLDASGGTMAYFATPPDIAPPTAVAVTLEPAGGSPGPTSEMYLVGKPASAL